MKIFSVAGKIISNIEHSKLHHYIVSKISQEFANLVENCYYPKMSECYRDLLHMTNTKQSDLIEYSKNKYNHPKFKVLNDPQNTLIILITQEFLNKRDLAGAIASFHFLALRQYTNLLYKYTTKKNSSRKLCLPDVFQTALDQISKNHLINKQKTIANMIIYLSQSVFQKYIQDLRNDNSEQMLLMINELRTRLNQSVKGFFRKYHAIAKSKESGNVSKDEKEHDLSHETKVRSFAEKISNEMCVYGNIRTSCIEKSSQLLKFNKQLSLKYTQELSKIEFREQVQLAIYLLLKDMKDLSLIKGIIFLDYIKKLMAIKITKQPIYFKKIINEIHIKIIKNSHLEKWFSDLSIQSKSISRNYIAYYIAFYLQESV